MLALRYMEYISLLNKVKDLENSNVCSKEFLILGEIYDKLEELRKFFQRPISELQEELNKNV